MATEASEAAAALLAEEPVLTLASVDSEGPWAADVYFVVAGPGLSFLSSPGSRHARAYAADPRAAATVHARSEGWRDIRGLQIAGRVETAPRKERARILAAYERKFPFVARLRTEVADLLDRVRLYRLSPDRVLLVRNATGFGSREEVPLADLFG